MAYEPLHMAPGVLMKRMYVQPGSPEAIVAILVARRFMNYFAAARVFTWAARARVKIAAPCEFR